jgi:lipopolysaccharide biosynthesis regulator YciM
MAILADLMLEARLAPDRIRPLVELLGARDSNPARAAILAARLARLEDDNAAFDSAVSKAESALAPGDWERRRELAVVLLESALDNNPKSARANKDLDGDLKRSANWFAEAINHNNQDIEALWGYGTAALHLGQNLSLAEQALTGAYQRAPASADIAVALAELKIRQKKPDEAIPYLQDTIRNASDLDMRRWATDTLESTQAYVVSKRKQ